MQRRNTFATCISVALVLLLSLSYVFANPAPETKEGPITLTFVETMTSPERTLVLQDLIGQYEASHPGIKIDLISPPYEQSDNKLTMMLNSNQVVDICETRDNTEKQFVNNGKLRDLTPYLDKWEGKSKLLDLTFKAARTVDNIPYLLPECFYVKALFVRKDILEKYGVAIPTTKDEFHKACIEITSKAPGQYGYDHRGRNTAFKISDILMITDIGNVDPNNLMFDLDGNFIYDSEKGKAALASFAELFNKACPKDSINWGFNEQINGFVSGTTPFLVQDPDTIGVLASQLEPDQYTVIPMPIGKSGVRYIDYGFAGLSIPTTSKHPDEAWDFITWFSDAERNAEFCKSYGPLPISKSSFNDDPYFGTGYYKAWAEELQDPNTTFVTFPLDSPLYPGWSSVEEQSMQSLLLGDITVDQLVEIWKNYWEQ